MFKHLRAHFSVFVISSVAFLSFLFLLSYLYMSTQGPNTRAGGGETVTLSFDPATANASANTDFTTTIKATPSSTMNIVGYLIKVGFDNTKVKVKNIQYKLGVVSAGLGDTTDTDAATAAINANQVAHIQGEIQAAAGQVLPVSATDVATITFTSVSGDASAISVSADSQFYKINLDNTISPITVSAPPAFSVNGGATPTPTPASSCTIPTGTPSATLNLKLKFQGIAKKPADAYNKMPVKITVAAPGGVIMATSCGDFTSGDTGIWSANVPLNLDMLKTASAAPGLKILVKGPKHLQKKVCGGTPTETAPGTYSCSDGNITLNTVANNLDFSGITLLSGDLPTQDGIVDSYDISLIRNNLGKTDAATLVLCDINLDGVCNTQDYSLLIAALSVKTDEQ